MKLCNVRKKSKAYCWEVVCMKKCILTLSVFFVAIGISIPAYAYDFKIGDFCYNIIEGNSVEVTEGVKYSGIIVIPEQVIYNGKTYNVTSIGKYAFLFCNDITSITIPNSITSIAEYAFWGSDLKSIYIPSSVTTIGVSVFYQCYYLSSITVDKSNSVYDSRNNCNAIIESSKNTLIAGCKNTIIPNGVISIGNGAFAGCRDLKSITIPKSVKNIASASFSSCINLESIIVEEGNTALDSRDHCNAVIATTSNTLIVGCKNTKIPNDVKIIGVWSFEGISSLTSIEIPESVTTIQWGAFIGCGMTSLVIPNSVTYIGGGAFDGCKLTSVVIPNSVTYLGEAAFQSCKDLTSVTISSGLANIEESVFNGCSSLTSISIPNSVTSIGDYAFSRCSGLTSIKVESGNTVYDSRNNCNAIIKKSNNELIVGCRNTVIPNSVTSIGNSAFSDCSGLTSISIPNSVTSIGNYAFYYCSGLTSISIPNSVTTIGNGAFYYCSGLKDVISEIKTPFEISENVFSVYSTAKLTVPSGTKSAYQSTNYWNKFSNIVESTSESNDDFGKVANVVDLGLSVKWASWNIGASKIGDYGGLYGAGDPTGKKTSTNVSDYYFNDGGSICGTEYDLAHVKWGDLWRMPKWSELEELKTKCTWTNGEVDGVKGSWVKGPNGNSIFLPWAGNRKGTSTFSGKGSYGYYWSGDMGVSLHSYGYKDLDIGSGGVNQTDGAENYWGQSIRPVYGDSNNGSNTSTKRTIHVATAGTLPNLISESEKYTIEELTLTGELNGTDFRLLRDMAGCNYLGDETSGQLKVLDISETRVVIGGERYVDTDHLPGWYGSFRYTVDKNDVLPQWIFAGCKFTSVSIPNSVTSIGSYAFSYCGGLTSISIPNSVTSIGSSAFSNCRGLTSISIPNSVTSIGNGAFESCSGLTSIKVESGNTVYDSRNNCNAIIKKSNNELIAGCKNTVIPNSVTSIGNYAFYYCRGLTSISIPNSVTSIGNSAFSSCSGLTSISIPNSVTSIDNSAFSRCSGLTSISIPNSVTSIGSQAFSYCSGLTSISIPNSVTSIGSSAFSNCSGLKDVISEIKTPFEISEDVFSVYSTAKLTVPSGTKSAYQSTAGWNKFTNIVETSFGEWREVTKSFDKSIVFKKIRVKNTRTSSGVYCCVFFSTKPNDNTTADTKYNINFNRLTIGDGVEQDDSRGYIYINTCKSIGDNWYEYEFKQPVYFSHYQSNSPTNQLLAYVEGTGTNDGVTIIANNYTREYGNANPSFEYTVSGGSISGTPKITCSATKTSSVGTYTIKIEKGSVTNSNVTFVDGTLTITKAPLTITAKSYTRKQGESNPSFDVTYSGFKNNETSSVLTRRPTCSTTATSSSSPGTYDINVSGASATNYDITYAKGTLTVTKADAIVLTARSYTREYGDANPSFSYTKSGAALNGTPTITCSATRYSPVGTYPIRIAQGSVSNYNVTYVEGTLTITKAPLTITAKSYTRKQGESNPSFEVTYSGFKNGESSSYLDRLPTCSTTATSSSSPGTYDINVSGASATNYDISYVKGKLTVTQADAVIVTARNYTRVYGEDNPSFGYYTSGATLNGTPSISCSATRYSDVGTYPIRIAQGSISNYNVTYVEGTLTITKAPLTITAKSYTRKQGESNPTFDVTYSGFKNGDNSSVLTRKPTCSTTAVSSSSPGTYDINVSGASATNYDISYVKGKLTVTPADAVFVTARSYTRVYGDDNPSFSYSTSGATLNGTPSISCSATRYSAVGTYPIKIAQGSVSNYNVTYVEGTLTITKAPLTITAKSYTREEGQSNPTFEVTYSGFKNGETESVLDVKPSVSTEATTSSPIGNYALVPYGAQANNYNMFYYNGTLTVTEKSVESVTDDGITYLCTNTTRTAEVQSVDYGMMNVEIPYSFSYNGKTYQVTSIANGALSNRIFNYVSLPSTVTTISSTTFSNSRLGALIWNANASLSSSVFNNMAMLTNSNFLLYVNSKSYAPSNVSNVVVGSTASSITLKDGIDTRFYCPKAFKAQDITYTHHYGMTTGGKGKGWETIALPFDVQRIEHKTKGVLTPFALYNDMMTQRPFWLYEFGSNGFRRTDAIKANTPYIIAMPNDSKYDEEYILAGDVTFSATNAQVYETESLVKPSSNGKTFAPAFAVVNSSTSVYALNVSNDLTYYNGSYDAGSRFVSNLRNVYPFEAYMTTSSSGARTLAIEFEDGATGIEDMPIMYRSEGRVKVYNLTGLLMFSVPQSDFAEKWKYLPSGVYIVNGKKMIKTDDAQYNIVQ